MRSVIFLFLMVVSGLVDAGEAVRLVRLPVERMLSRGAVRLSATETDIGGPKQVVGSSDQRMCRFVEQPAQFTLVFNRPVTIRGARVRFSHHAGTFRWNVLCADEAQDAESRRAVMEERATAGDRTDEANWPPVASRRWRLVCREEGGDRFVHLRWFALLCSEGDYLSHLTGGTRLNRLRLVRDGKPAPAAIELAGNQAAELHVEAATEEGATLDLTGAARLVSSAPQVLEPLDGRILVPRRPGRCSVHAEIGQHASPLLRASVLPARDLILLCIERTPRYPKYHPRYESSTFDEGFARHEATFAVGLEQGETPQTQRWPEVGDTVTYRAVVFNRGNVDIEDAQALWLVDGREQASLPVPPLKPGETTAVTFHRPWTERREAIACRLLVREDATEDNNHLARASDALEFLFLIEEGYRLRFAARTERVKKPSTASIVGWVHHHVRRFNALFAGRGCRTRIAVGHLAILPDGAPEPALAFIAKFDGRFPPRFRAGDSDWRLGGSAYYRAEEDVDYGFLHECGHQLGLIDLYRLNLESSQNRVNGQRYRWGDGLMCNVAPVLSEHSARALDAWHGVRRGFYGQYLYDLPATIAIRLTDADGQVLSRAPVAVYQRLLVPGKGERLWPKPKFRGETDGEGVYTLPSVPVEHKGMTLPTGNALRPNPWGHVACIGVNGLFLIEVAAKGKALYAWLPITRANLAFWRGERQRAVLPLTARPAKAGK
jgi:hypothetical protein